MEMEDFEAFIKERFDNRHFNLQSFRSKATFIAHNIESLSSPGTIKGKTGKTIPVGVVETDTDHMDTLCSRKWIFQCMEISFSKNSNTDSNLVYPQCNICLQWEHWNQKCPNKIQKCCFRAEEHHMSTCTNKTSKCANCGGSHRSYYKGCPCFKAYVDAWKTDIEMKRNQSNQ
ncbi:hypothetical protein ACOME3_010835 [Neoechinorhynchus agilis]